MDVLKYSCIAVDLFFIIIYSPSLRLSSNSNWKKKKHSYQCIQCVIMFGSWKMFAHKALLLLPATTVVSLRAADENNYFPWLSIRSFKLIQMSVRRSGAICLPFPNCPCDSRRPTEIATVITCLDCVANRHNYAAHHTLSFCFREADVAQRWRVSPRRSWTTRTDRTVHSCDLLARRHMRKLSKRSSKKWKTKISFTTV